MRFKRSFLKELPQAVEQRLHKAGIDTLHGRAHFVDPHTIAVNGHAVAGSYVAIASGSPPTLLPVPGAERSDDHPSELQSLIRISYAVFCFKNKQQLTRPYIITSGYKY